MIPLLRLTALAGNVAFVGGATLLLGGPPWLAAAACALFFGIAWWRCGATPKTRDASNGLRALAEQVAARMGAAPPRSVAVVDGWTAAAFRSRGGYGLLVGAEVEKSHLEAVLAHEIAHWVTGDLGWEPFTDGPARLLLEWAVRVPPFLVLVSPLLVTAAPLARATELVADRLAAAAVPGYDAVLRRIAERMGTATSILYPSLPARIRDSARHSMRDG